MEQLATQKQDDDDKEEKKKVNLLWFIFVTFTHNNVSLALERRRELIENYPFFMG